MISTRHIERWFEELVGYTKVTLKNGLPLSKDPCIRQKLADIAIEINVARNLVRRVAWLQDKEIIPSYESAILKVFITELYQRLAREGLEITGLYGILRKDSKYSVLKGIMEHHFRASFVATIGGCSSEIMRNIIALRGLGLPR
jgi:alkylation response protein AidB-like acyl-CoA dehydrogenase